jgi:DNA polymerase III epsilon subunit-like protein
MPDGRRALVYTDTETTGLSLHHHQLVELGWAVDDGDVIAGIVPHTLEHAEPRALEVNRYYERNLDFRHGWNHDLVEEFMRAAAGNIIVGANPAFDAYRIERHAGYSTWYYRLADIASAAWLMLGFEEPPGLRRLRDRLTELGYEVPEPDHAAGGDVRTVRACLKVLQQIAEYQNRAGLPTAEQIKAWRAGTAQD